VLNPDKARWNPCQPITWGIVQDKARKSEAAIVRKAFKRITKTTGMTFTYLPGPVSSSKPNIRMNIQLTKDWSYSGFAHWSWRTQKSFQLSVLRKAIVFATLGRKNPQRARLGLYLHELGHAMGLQHTAMKGSVMYPIGPGPVNWSKGDRRGLRLLGRPAGCMNPPAPVTDLSAVVREGSLDVQWRIEPTDDPIRLIDVMRIGQANNWGRLQSFDHDPGRWAAPIDSVTTTPCEASILVVAYNRYGQTQAKIPITC
jgi:hypothetical protein